MKKSNVVLREPDPIPLVPPVTRAVFPCRDHLLLLSASAISTLTACVFLVFVEMGVKIDTRVGGLLFTAFIVITIVDRLVCESFPVLF